MLGGRYPRLSILTMKQRLRLAAMDVLHEVRGAAERRRMEMMESEEDDVE